MSMSALMRAIRDFLQQDGGFGTDKCRIMKSGRPSSIAGDLFISVSYGYKRDNGSNGESLDLMYGVRVTVNMRSTKFSTQDIGEAIIAPDDGEGIDDVCDRIIAMMHCDPRSEFGEFGIRQRANQYLKGGQNNGFITGPELIDPGVPTEQPSSWWGGEGNGIVGMSQEILFGNL